MIPLPAALKPSPFETFQLPAVVSKLKPSALEPMLASNLRNLFNDFTNSVASSSA
jgi:hypothetical protein